MFHNISILGSTGSIGTQTIAVCREFDIRISGLAAGSNLTVLQEQILEFRPEVASVRTQEDANQLAPLVAGSGTRVLWGEEGIFEVARVAAAECVVSAIVGIAGLMPTLEAIKAGKHIALANKEVLVTAGAIVMEEMRKRNLLLLPVDSEHSAIFQCLMGNDREAIRRIILTCSGGPFREKSRVELEGVTPAMALQHPNWAMGSKITIDSATLMNKGLEVIEARWLFDVLPGQIDVVIHPQSIVHSLVEFQDTSVMAQLGLPDMKLPIQLALTWPNRMAGGLEPLDLVQVGHLDFSKPDCNQFRCLQLAYDAIRVGGTMPTVLNAANEVAVQLFLEEKISFLGIARLIDAVMQTHAVIDSPTLEEILWTDAQARKLSLEVRV
ncbi:MAG: 1-deoxy-D-xylulose-5-phosphate reductoisomerase [Clostridia bacterium]